MEWIVVVTVDVRKYPIFESAQTLIDWLKAKGMSWPSRSIEDMIKAAGLQHIRLKKCGHLGEKWEFVVDRDQHIYDARLYPASQAPKFVHIGGEWDIEDGTDMHTWLERWAEAKDLETAKKLAEAWMDQAKLAQDDLQDAASQKAWQNLDSDYKLLAEYIESHYPQFGPVPKQDQYREATNEA